MDSPTRTGDGRWNGAYTFDGVDDYIEVPSVGITSGSFTLAGWIKPAAIDYGFATFMGYDAGHRVLINCNNLRLLVELGGNFFSSGTINPLDTRSHIVYMYDASSNKEYFYINGIYDSEDTPGATPTWDSQFRIGQYD